MKKSFKFEIIGTLLSFVVSIVTIYFLFTFISGAFEDASKQIGGKSGLSSIIAKGMDAVEQFKDDVNSKRKK